MVFGQPGLASASSLPISLRSAAQAVRSGRGLLPGGGQAMGTLQTPFS